jgi:hypothetical protein
MNFQEEIISSHTAQALKPFQSASLRPLKLVFNVKRLKDRLDFVFILSSRVPTDMESLVLSDPSEPMMRKRRDELWKSTCLEIFVGSSQGAGYLELNMAPSGDWNLYAFDQYRTAMRPAQNPHPPLVKMVRSASGDAIEFHGSLKKAADSQGKNPCDIHELLSSPGLVMGATAVLEYKTGEREYWALAHAGEKPDFHLRESFRLAL